jgi:hypothetical protein
MFYGQTHVFFVDRPDMYIAYYARKSLGVDFVN